MSSSIILYTYLMEVVKITQVKTVSDRTKKIAQHVNTTTQLYVSKRYDLEHTPSSETYCLCPS